MILMYYGILEIGEIYREDLASAEEAANRLKDIKGLLLGTTVAELQGRITEQQNTIVEQTKIITETNENINNAALTAANINGEEANNG